MLKRLRFNGQDTATAGQSITRQHFIQNDARHLLDDLARQLMEGNNAVDAIEKLRTKELLDSLHPDMITNGRITRESDALRVFTHSQV